MSEKVGLLQTGSRARRRVAQVWRPGAILESRGAEGARFFQSAQATTRSLRVFSDNHSAGRTLASTWIRASNGALQNGR